MKQTIIFNYMPMDLNRYIRAERTNRFIAAKIKREETEMAHFACKSSGIKPIKKSVYIHFFWYMKNKRKDPDNIAFAKKFILDGMVSAGILENDTREYILGFSDNFVDDSQEQVIVNIVEV